MFMSLNKSVALGVLGLFIQGCGQSASTDSISVDDERNVVVASPNANPTTKEPTDSLSAQSANNARKRLVHSTPEECYSAMLRAAEIEDFETIFSCFALADRNQQVGWVAYQVEREVFFQTDKRDAALALLQKSALDKTDIMGLMQIYDSPGGKGVAKAVELVGATIKDQPDFMKEASVLLKEEPGGSNPTGPREELIPVLSGVVIKNDRASGTLQIPDSDESTPIFFIKENGSWVITSEPIEKDSR